LSGTSRKFDPLDAHLRAIAYRNGGVATLSLAIFAAVLWPTDALIFGGMPEVVRTLVWVRAALIVILMVAWLLMRSPLGPKRPTLILSTAGVLVMVMAGWGFGEIGGPQQPWIHLAHPALFFSILAPVRLRERTILVAALAIAICGGFLVPHPQYWHDPMSRVMLSFEASLAIMVIAVGHLAFRILRQSYYQARALDELNATLESRVRAQTADLQQLNDRLVRAREEERAFVSRELHDELGQELTALNLQLALTRNRFEKDANAIGPNLGELEALLARTRATTRRLLTELRSSVLDELGLDEALAKLARETEQRSGVRCSLKLETLPPLSPERATVAFRVVQEALTNVVRHAQAKAAEVHLRMRERRLELEVFDDGVGIAPERERAGLGLTGIRERVAGLDGTLTVGRREGGGTRLEVKLPLGGEA
jgi:signal transduction histidine kinase